MFLDDNWVVRLNLGLGVNSNKDITYDTNADDEEIEITSTETTTTFSIMPGFEYHFNNFDRISPYVGAELGFRTGSTKTVDENEDADTRSEVKNPLFGFTINAVSGVDVYLCKGLYVGAELGLGYNLTNNKRSSSVFESGKDKTETDGNSSKKVSSFGFHVTPTLRIGWFF